MALKLVVALALFGAANAVCPNQCSGHGTCGLDDVCVCYQDWGMGDEMSGDCSLRYCPFEYAFVDAPDETGRFHKYMECSGKGLCDRSTGECECFEGYAGKGCQRTTCPNDCSGHGTCEYIEELTFGSTPGEYDAAMVESGHTTRPFNTRALTVEAMSFNTIHETWDFHKSMACVCDPQYIDVDCSRRMCPKGNDVMDTRLDTSDALKWQVQNITLMAAGTYGNGSESSYTEFTKGDFALTFVSTVNETFTTIPIKISTLDIGSGVLVSGIESQLSDDIKYALQSLPNEVIDKVTVSVNIGDDSILMPSENAGQAFINFRVTFDGETVQGPQNLLIVEADKCDSGCTPKLTGLNLMSDMSAYQADATSSDAMNMVSELIRSDYNNYECGRRGKCDYDSGVCECFEGYTGVACGLQTALV